MEVLHTARHDTGLPGFVPTLPELLRRSDIVSLHVPLNESTRHLIGAAELAVMKPTAVLVNTARGPVVDEDALVDALEAGTIFAAGLDVFDGEPAVNPRLLDGTPGDAAPPHRQCDHRHADPHGPSGLPGGMRRPGGADAAQHGAPRAAALVGATVPPEVPHPGDFPRGRGIRSTSRWRTLPGVEEVTVRTVRGLTVVALSTVLALALIGVLGIRGSAPAGRGDDTSLANDRQLRRRWRTCGPCPALPASRRAQRPASPSVTTVATSPPSS